ncbi:MAG: DUF58 domain-containing protein [Eubacteriales bacterium]
MTKARVLYFCALLFSVFFAMTLYHRITLVVMLLILLMPLLSLLMMFISYNFLKYEVVTQERYYSKREKSNIRIVVSNDCFIPIPWVKMTCRQLDESGRRTIEKIYQFNLFAYKFIEIMNPVVFNRRGLYEVGVLRIEMTDFMGLFRIRFNVDRLEDIRVVPKKTLTQSLMNTTLSENGDEKRQGFAGDDKTIVSHIRDYAVGDSYKAIHWKLSARTDELLVKAYQRPNDNHVIVVADLQSYLDDADLCEDSVDAVVESALSVALRCVYDEIPCTLVWYDVRAGQIVWYPIESMPQFEDAFEHLAVAPVSYDGIYLEQIIQNSQADATEDTVLFFLSSGIDNKTADVLTALAAVDSSEVCFICFDLVDSQTTKDYITQLLTNQVKAWRIPHTDIEQAISSIAGV